MTMRMVLKQRRSGLTNRLPSALYSLYVPIICDLLDLSPHTQAINHGIPEALLDRLVSKGRDMFALPRDEKAAFKVRLLP